MAKPATKFILALDEVIPKMQVGDFVFFKQYEYAPTSLVQLRNAAIHYVLSRKLPIKITTDRVGPSLKVKRIK